MNDTAGVPWGLGMGALVLVLVTIITVVLIVQAARTWRARSLLARDEAYRQLAEKVTASQSSLASAGAVQAEELSEIRQRLASIEKLLRDVQ